MTNVFFTATKKALSNITSTYDVVWPIAVGLWNLRCMVNGVKKEYPDITEEQLAAKFSLGSRIHGVNYKRAFVDHTWEQQQTKLAWILLNSTIPIFEGWLEELKRNRFSDMDDKKLQFPDQVRSEVSRLVNSSSAIIRNSFYPTYLGKQGRCYGQIEELLHCYRIFKEARNCYMHNGSKADEKLVNAYNLYIPFATTAALCVSEVPEFPRPIQENEIQISLRGVVGFSSILIRILVSLDTELLRAANAESEFISRFRTMHTDLKLLESNPNSARRQVEKYVQECGFPKPLAIDELTEFLINHNLLSR